MVRENCRIPCGKVVGSGHSQPGTVGQKRTFPSLRTDRLMRSRIFAGIIKAARRHDIRQP